MAWYCCGYLCLSKEEPESEGHTQSRAERETWARPGDPIQVLELAGPRVCHFFHH